ncbi:hypothetical protein AOX55_0000269 [Sinorhizobium fredii CCBAU 25509]|nr:hypothetical protein AOX55_0000269 [Sinorhizobium fredii CCBAU 25509]
MCVKKPGLKEMHNASDADEAAFKERMISTHLFVQGCFL